MCRQFIKDSWVTALCLLVAGFIMSAFAFSPFTHKLSTFLKFASFTSSMWIFLWLGNSISSDLVSLRIKWTEEPVKRFWIGMLVMIGYTVTAVLFLVLVFRFVFDFNVANDSEDLLATIYGSLAITFVISLFMHGRGFLLNWRLAALEAETSKRESIKAQYESLKNQVNPHFLFNSLNALTSLVYQDQDQAAKFIKQLSEVYRYVLDTRGKELVPVSEELHFVRSYLFLQQIRFGSKLRIEIDAGSSDFFVAPLALQMLIENAIKHNIISDENPLNVRLYTTDQWVIVENTLQPKATIPEDSSGLGLDNIRKRYEFLSNQPVEVLSEDHKFVVRLPQIKD